MRRFSCGGAIDNCGPPTTLDPWDKKLIGEVLGFPVLTAPEVVRRGSGLRSCEAATLVHFIPDGPLRRPQYRPRCSLKSTRGCLRIPS